MSGGIEFQRAVKRFGSDQQAVLNGIDLKVEPGQVICIVGPSGCGENDSSEYAGWF